MAPERPDLRAEVTALRATLDKLNEVLAEKVQQQVDAKVAEVDPVPRAEIARDYEPRAELVRRRRRALMLVAAAMVGSLLVNNGAISQCFLGPPSTGLERRICGLAFPGFEASRRQADVRLGQFLGLLEAIPANTARSQDNQRRLEELTKRVERLEGKRH